MVQLIGVDNWNGSPSQLNTFRLATGITFPLLLFGTNATGGNVETLYGLWDNYIVLDMSDTTVTYHAALSWPHGDRYHLGEVRAAVDAILATVDAGGPPVSSPALRLAPNPTSDRLRVEYVNPSGGGAQATIAVLDARGRARTVLFRGTVPPGSGAWEGSLAAAFGSRPAPGVYFLRLELKGTTLVHRFVVLP